MGPDAAIYPSLKGISIAITGGAAPVFHLCDLKDASANTTSAAFPTNRAMRQIQANIVDLGFPLSAFAETLPDILLRRRGVTF